MTMKILVLVACIASMASGLSILAPDEPVCEKDGVYMLMEKYLNQHWLCSFRKAVVVNVIGVYETKCNIGPLKFHDRTTFVACQRVETTDPIAKISTAVVEFEYQPQVRFYGEDSLGKRESVNPCAGDGTYMKTSLVDGKVVNRWVKICTDNHLVYAKRVQETRSADCRSGDVISGAVGGAGKMFLVCVEDNLFQAYNKVTRDDKLQHDEKNTFVISAKKQVSDSLSSTTHCTSDTPSFISKNETHANICVSRAVIYVSRTNGIVVKVCKRDHVERMITSPNTFCICEAGDNESTGKYCRNYHPEKSELTQADPTDPLTPTCPKDYLGHKFLRKYEDSSIEICSNGKLIKLYRTPDIVANMECKVANKVLTTRDDRQFLLCESDNEYHMYTSSKLDRVTDL